MPHVLVVSPHLDDAVLGCTHRLASGAHVVTVFAGAPRDVGSAPWDRLTGARSPTDRHAERLAEDSAAMTHVPVTTERWDFLDGQYRPGVAADVDAIAERLAPLMSPATEVWVTAGVGHADHAAARRAAARAATAAGIASITLYADVPHAIPYGWPASVTGAAAPPHLDADAWLEDQLAEAGLDARALTAHVVHLDDATRALKQQLLDCYPSQLPALALTHEHVRADPTLLSFELAWTHSL